MKKKDLFSVSEALVLVVLVGSFFYFGMNYGFQDQDVAGLALRQIPDDIYKADFDRAYQFYTIYDWHPNEARRFWNDWHQNNLDWEIRKLGEDEGIKGLEQGFYAYNKDTGRIANLNARSTVRMIGVSRDVESVIKEEAGGTESSSPVTSTVRGQPSTQLTSFSTLTSGAPEGVDARQVLIHAESETIWYLDADGGIYNEQGEIEEGTLAGKKGIVRIDSSGQVSGVKFDKGDLVESEIDQATMQTLMQNPAYSAFNKEQRYNEINQIMREEYGSNYRVVPTETGEFYVLSNEGAFLYDAASDPNEVPPKELDFFVEGGQIRLVNPANGKVTAVDNPQLTAAADDFYKGDSGGLVNIITAEGGSNVNVIIPALTKGEDATYIIQDKDGTYAGEYDPKEGTITYKKGGREVTRNVPKDQQKEIKKRSKPMKQKANDALIAEVEGQTFNVLWGVLSESVVAPWVESYCKSEYEASNTPSNTAQDISGVTPNVYDQQDRETVLDPNFPIGSQEGYLDQSNAQFQSDLQNYQLTEDMLTDDMVLDMPTIPETSMTSCYGPTSIAHAQIEGEAGNFLIHYTIACCTARTMNYKVFLRVRGSDVLLVSDSVEPGDTVAETASSAVNAIDEVCIRTNDITVGIDGLYCAPYSTAFVERGTVTTTTVPDLFITTTTAAATTMTTTTITVTTTTVTTTTMQATS